MKSKEKHIKRVLTMLVTLVFVLTLTLSSVALAHGGEEAGIPWLEAALVSGGTVVFGVAAYFAIKGRS